MTALLAAAGSASAGAGAGRAAFIPPLNQDHAEVWAVGDGADGSDESIAVARMIAQSDPDRFLYLGDVYPAGTAADFADRYEPSYGRLSAITAPTIGNHEDGNRLTGYDPYWRVIRGRTPPDYYSFRVAGWQLISLNSQIDYAPDSPQLDWLRRTVSGPGNCRIAFWHRPRFNADTKHNGDSRLASFWDALRGHAKLIVNGHDHNMQRFTRTEGLVQLVSGAGGDRQYPVNSDYPGLEFSNDTDAGALRLRLRPGRLRYAFFAVGLRKLDSGTLRCRRKG